MRLLTILLTGLTLMAALPAAAFDTRAGAAYVLDQTTGSVLLSKNADKPLPPASMSKLMTLNMLFEALQDGRVNMGTQFSVSTKAKNMGGSTMFLNERDRPTVEDLIQGIIVQSGNDACVVVAEGLAGTEGDFARLMTDRARMLGMENATFGNASGWPHPNQRMSMKDLAILAQRLITEFPEYYGYFAQREFDFDGRAPQNRFNRNPLLKLSIGADGLKTGHTSEAGYGLVGSAVQGKRRVIFVITGLQSEGARAEEAERVVNWAFRQFVQKTVAEKGTRMAEAPVWMGNMTKVGLVTPTEVTLLVPAVRQGEAQAEIQYRGPLKAPIAEGQHVADLVIEMPGIGPLRQPLVAEQAVAHGGFVPRLRTAAQVLFRQFAGEAQGL